MRADTKAGRWDTIVCTQVIEHLDDDALMLQKLMNHTDKLVYSVPNNCLPPGLEPEHRHVYPLWYVEQITPFLVKTVECGHYLVVICERNKDANVQ